MKLAAQILGVLALGENAFIFLSRKRERILQLKLLSDILWMGNYLLLGAYTGAALNGIAILRELVFLQRDCRRWADAPWWPVFFAAFSWISPILEWVRPAAHSPDPGQYALCHCALPAQAPLDQAAFHCREFALDDLCRHRREPQRASEQRNPSVFRPARTAPGTNRQSKKPKLKL